MKAIEKVYLVGLGAIGCSYAAKLYDYNPEIITVIANSQRIEKYQQSGVRINNTKYNFKYINPKDKAPYADLVLVCVKQHQLEQAIEDMRPFIGPDTIIISLLNGISSEDVIKGALNNSNILNAFCVGTDAVRIGTNTTLTKVGTIVYGDKSNSLTPQVLAAKELFEKAQIPYSIPEDIIREQWWKFMMNVGINQISAILKAPYGIFSNFKEAADLIFMASMEVVNIAQRIGINLSKDDIKKYIDILHTLSPEGKTSMLQDIEAGRKTEVEIFSATVSSLGLKHNVSTPVNDMLYKMIRTLEYKNNLS